MWESAALHRRPNAESSADVFDRVTQFWDKLFEDNGKGLLTEPNVKYEMCVMVTHGLTIRLMLMCLFKWSVETFASVWNLGNCEHVTLKKNVKEHRYEHLGCSTSSKQFSDHYCGPWVSPLGFLAPSKLAEDMHRRVLSTTVALGNTGSVDCLQHQDRPTGTGIVRRSQGHAIRVPV